MKYLKLLICSITVLLASCVSRNEKDIPPQKIEDFMSHYYSGYQYNYKDISTRKNKNYGPIYALMEIDKSLISRAEMDLIYKRMISDGWRVIEKKSNVIDLCKGENILITILFPVNSIKGGENNDGIVFHNMEVWNIFYYSRYAPITDCNLNPDIIDFKGL